jgi:hypothetical protein
MTPTSANEAPFTRPAWIDRKHAMVLGVLWVCFTILTYAAVSGGLTNASQERGLVAITTLSTMTGPMTGAISRRFQSCCLHASLMLLPYAATGLIAGIAFQAFPLPHRAVWQAVRLSVWGLGWFVWFGSGIVSFAHALS